MTDIKSYKDLLVWQRGIEIVVLTYQLSKNFPSDESYSLSNQIKRAAVSISSNIAEGYGRNTNKSFSHFLDIARGSLFEFETQLLIANELNFIIEKEIFDKLNRLIEEESKMINAFSKSLTKAN